jgi:hypothetical protein
MKAELTIESTNVTLEDVENLDGQLLQYENKSYRIHLSYYALRCYKKTYSLVRVYSTTAVG